MKTAIDAMLDDLDPYTNYIPESEIEDYRFMTTGQYGGIGALISKRGEYVMISEPYEGFPAWKAGLRAGDIILEVDGISIKGKTTEDVSKLLKGQPGTKVSILVKKAGKEKPVEISLIREEIKIDNVPYYGVLKDSIGYVALNSFTYDASEEVKNAIKELKEKGAKRLILDLRNNGGGLLHEAVKIVNLFVPKGELIVYTKGKIKDWDHEYRAQSPAFDPKIPLVVLVNRNSASASEIVAGALQDLDRAVIIGENTFGKGLVQQTRDISYNSKLKLTVAKYYIPSGRCIQKLDYSHKDKEGKALAIPDSLKKEFKTKKGRIVRDGDGIEPDIKIEKEAFHPIAGTLLQKHLIFDFATQYYLTHQQIPEPENFRLSDEEYQSFVSFVKEKDYNYETHSEKELKQLEKALKQDKYIKDTETELEALKKALEERKKKDIIDFQEEISELIENEIVSRYYFQKGRIRYNLSISEEVKKGIEVLRSPSLYQEFLSSSFSSSKNND
jgi:carboxyl-terminal processing protease